jgi:hypothetical protein
MKLKFKPMHLVSSKSTGAIYVVYEGNERELKHPRGNNITTRFHVSNRLEYAKKVRLKKL